MKLFTEEQLKDVEEVFARIRQDQRHGGVLRLVIPQGEGIPERVYLHIGILVTGS